MIYSDNGLQTAEFLAENLTVDYLFRWLLEIHIISLLQPATASTWTPERSVWSYSMFVLTSSLYEKELLRDLKYSFLSRATCTASGKFFWQPSGLPTFPVVIPISMSIVVWIFERYTAAIATTDLKCHALSKNCWCQRFPKLDFYLQCEPIIGTNGIEFETGKRIAEQVECSAPASAGNNRRLFHETHWNISCRIIDCLTHTSNM